MKIFKSDPENWQDLQNKCSKLLADIGFNTEVEKDIETVRGKVNIDVFAINQSIAPNEIILVECKNWNTQVPKTIAHAFRSVVSDYGANSGYIISKEGFQTGTYEAVNSTNVSLMDFNEFQQHFKIRYLNYVTSKLQKIGYPLRKYSDYMETIWNDKLRKLPKEKQDEHTRLCIKYDNISMSSLIMNYKNLLTGELELDYIDQVIQNNSKRFPPDVVVEPYSEYFDWLINFCQTGVKEFDDLFGKSLEKNNSCQQ